MPKSLITVDELMQSMGTAHSPLLCDCRFSLTDPAAGRAAYSRGHLPGAHYLDLNADLSSPVQPGRTGRHPLPDMARFARTMGKIGVSAGRKVVAYDDGSGAIAARLWWLLRYAGHDAVAVLDGGFAAYIAAGHAVDTSSPSALATEFQLRLRPELVVDAETAGRFAVAADHLLLDAREGARYRGEQEPIDPVAGHIPGALSVPFAENLEAGRFKSEPQLRERYAQLLGSLPPERCAVYCGSGVTACHVILAAHHAGFPDLRLYAGSWSEWISDDSRPTACP